MNDNQCRNVKVLQVCMLNKHTWKFSGISTSLHPVLKWKHFYICSLNIHEFLLKIMNDNQCRNAKVLHVCVLNKHTWKFSGISTSHHPVLKWKHFYICSLNIHEFLLKIMNDNQCRNAKVLHVCVLNKHTWKFSDISTSLHPVLNWKHFYILFTKQTYMIFFKVMNHDSQCRNVKVLYVCVN